MDVDDKIIAAANSKGVDPLEYSKKFTDICLNDLDNLGIRRADVYPKATENIPEIIKLIEDYQAKEEIEKIREAFDFAKKTHKGQLRKSGEPYFIHPFEVAKILAKTRLDANTIIAGFLHDVIEDTETGAGEIEEKFGEDVKNIVLGVTKISTLDARKKESEAAENLIKMFLAAVEWDIRIIFVKLADRLHNMRTLKYLSRDRRKKIAKETIDIIAPLAQRLGISKVQRELEDLSLKYLKPEVYREIYLKMHYILKSQGEFFKEIEDVLNKELVKHEIKASIKGRVKNIYSVYNKMVKKQKEISEIYDIVALRIITEGSEIQNCYAVLGIVHSLWTPILNRVKDYIASPKPNFYRSLHTTVVGPKGNPLEIQIRTQDMHEIAEYGIAAHWLYKSGKKIDRSK